MTHLLWGKGFLRSSRGASGQHGLEPRSLPLRTEAPGKGCICLTDLPPGRQESKLRPSGDPPKSYGYAEAKVGTTPRHSPGPLPGQPAPGAEGRGQSSVHESRETSFHASLSQTMSHNTLGFSKELSKGHGGKGVALGNAKALSDLASGERPCLALTPLHTLPSLQAPPTFTGSPSDLRAA